jgi:hypothetical protein
MDVLRDARELLAAQLGIDDVSLVTLLEDITRTQQALRAGIAKMPPLTAPMNVAPWRSLFPTAGGWMRFKISYRRIYCGVLRHVAAVKLQRPSPWGR